MSDERKIIEVVVLDAEQYDAGFPPAGLKEFQAWLSASVAGIPPEYAASTTISIGGHSGYDSDVYPSVTIAYHRPETNAEMDARLAITREHTERRKAEELRQLAALKAKYENG